MNFSGLWPTSIAAVGRGWRSSPQRERSARPKLERGGCQTVPKTRNNEIDEGAQLERQAALLGVDQMHRTGGGLVGFEQQLQQVVAHIGDTQELPLRPGGRGLMV